MWGVKLGPFQEGMQTSVNMQVHPCSVYCALPVISPLSCGLAPADSLLQNLIGAHLSVPQEMPASSCARNAVPESWLTCAVHEPPWFPFHCVEVQSVSQFIPVIFREIYCVPFSMHAMYTCIYPSKFNQKAQNSLPDFKCSCMRKITCQTTLIQAFFFVCFVFWWLKKLLL